MCIAGLLMGILPYDYNEDPEAKPGKDTFPSLEEIAVVMNDDVVEMRTPMGYRTVRKSSEDATPEGPITLREISDDDMVRMNAPRESDFVFNLYQGIRVNTTHTTPPLQ